MAITFDVMKEPVGKTYRMLLLLASEMCSSLSLVWRDQMVFEPTAEEVGEALKPVLIREDRTDKWPGTTLLGHMATVRHYRMTDKALGILERAPGLYAWQAPALPEDLIFYAKNGSVWLGSIAHERDAWFECGSEIETILHARVPELVLARRRSE